MPVMRPLIHIAAGASLFWTAAGCGVSRPLAPSTSFVHYAKEVTLDPASPRDDWLAVKLLRVESDGTTVIDVRSTGETLKAAPGDYFLGKSRPPDNVRVFGEHGLQLVRSDPSAQSAVLLRRWAGRR
jgi:hypothetical protein